MSLSSTKDSTQTVYPKTVVSIVASVGGLALFLFFGSTLLLSQPIGAAVRGYFYGIDSSGKIDSGSSLNSTIYESNHTAKEGGKSNSTVLAGYGSNIISPVADDRGSLTAKAQTDVVDSVFDSDSSPSGPIYKSNHIVNTLEDGGKSNSTVLEGYGSNIISTVADRPAESGGEGNLTAKVQDDVIDSDCDLYHGKWMYDPTGPLYTNNSCPIITQMQNCQGNGRPDKDYENWRWKPSQCELPRFNPKNFLELMRGKTLAFVGDSVARNQMESMLCILWQVEVPKNRGNKKMQRYYFRSTSTMIVRIWSSWLVHQTSEPFDFAPAGIPKIHLDKPDESFMQYITNFDVIVLSSGHWFAKQSVYILNNEIVGGQLWWPDKSREQKTNNIEAFGISVETILTVMGTYPNYTGLTIVRSYSPDHYEGGGWNTGGSCTGKINPAREGELVESGFTNIMHKKQAMGFDRATKKKNNKSKMKFLDITKAFSYRHDGHPGPFRTPDPNKKTTRGPNGKPPPQDCLHWCMPGPVDTWNELVFEIIRREFQ